MTPEKIPKWLKHHPFKEKPYTWGLNEQIIIEIARLNSGPVKYCFGSDIAFELEGAKPKHPKRFRKETIEALEKYVEKGGDATWATQRIKEIKKFEDGYLFMLQMHGLKGPDGNWVFEGPLSDVAEYRYGPQKEGLGWRDGTNVLEIRTEKLPPLEFIAAYNKIITTLHENHVNVHWGVECEHMHLHVSAWEGGEPDAPGSHNIFDSNDPRDVEHKKSAVAELCFAAGNLVTAAYHRDDIRVPKNRIELRKLEKEDKFYNLHMGLEVLKTICNIRYAFLHPNAEHLPPVETAWRPYFSFPDNPYLQLAINQARFSPDTQKLFIGNEDDLVQLTGAGNNPHNHRLNVQAKRIRNGSEIKDASPMQEGDQITIQVSPAKFVDEDTTNYQGVEDALNAACIGGITTLACKGAKRSENTDSELFATNPAYSEHMVPHLYKNITDCLPGHKVKAHKKGRGTDEGRE